MSDSDNHRKELAKKLGLPETASWNDISKKQSDNHRKERAKELGLSETASWNDILKKQRVA